MGGRGAKSNLSGIPKNKRKSIKSYEERIKEHTIKIKEEQQKPSGGDKGLIHHWQSEINGFQNNIDKIKKRGKKK